MGFPPLWYKVMVAPVAGAAWDNGNNPANLVKVGLGEQTLSRDNTYTGTTTVNGGILQVGNGGTLVRNVNGELLDAHGTLGRTSAIAIGTNGTYRLSTVQTALWFGARMLGSTTIFIRAASAMCPMKSLTVPAAPWWFPPPFPVLARSKQGDIAPAGATGTTTLTGDNSQFSGAIKVDSGTLRVGDEIIDTITLTWPTRSGRTTAASLLESGSRKGPPISRQGASRLCRRHRRYLEQWGGDRHRPGSGATLAFNLANDYTESHAIQR